jgi:Rad3-related DNA helicase
MQNLLLNFPEPYTPRSKQVYALKKMQKALEEKKKFIILHADTGVGKTHIAKTLANISKDVPDEFKKDVNSYKIFGEDGPSLMDGYESFGCYSLTITKNLQDQYQYTFDDTGVLKGQGNYQCDVDDEVSVDVAPCLFSSSLKKECWNACRCPYYNARNHMLTSKFSALNYSMFFSLPGHLRRRQFIICDEGSELEDQLVSQFTCEVDIPFLMKVGVPLTSFPVSEVPDRVIPWLSAVFEEVSGKVDSLKSWFGDSSNKQDKVEYGKKKGDYTKLTNFQTKLSTLIGTYFDSQYIIEKVDKIIRFIPLKVDVLSKYVFDEAETVVILSATIIDPASYCKSLGIKDYEYIHVDTDFDPEKSPIHIMAKQKLNYSNLKSMLPTLIKQIEGIMENHKDEKGIIHTHTQFLTDYIKDKVGGDRILCRAAGVTNETLLEEHENTDLPTVLVSPSMTYGVDLKGDLAKFQIVLKAPWLPTKDVRVEKLMKMDKPWYSNAMLKTIVQAVGRGVRSEDDECVTYILDGSIWDAIIRNKSKLPKFFLDRFQ